MKESSLNELSHHLLNGVQVIKHICKQGRDGIMAPDEAFGKIEHRLKGMEQGFRTVIETQGT
jgi:two-component sensor histidine kinase